jgi:hypothetical protein
MRVLPVLTLVAFVGALLVPAAEAYSQPAWYYLKSDCPVDRVEGSCPVPEVPVPAVPAPPVPLPVSPPPVGQPKVIFADGILDPYNFLAPNPPNSTEPDVKPVYTASETVAPARFVTPANLTHPNRLKGYFFIGVYTGESAVPNGNLTATIYEVKEDGTELVLLTATAAIDLNTSKAPDPMSLLPPNSTDPMVIAYYEAAQVLPLVLTPPNIFLLGPVDLNFSNTSRLALGFHIAQGSSPSPEPPGVATITFNSTVNPSFLYVPWYAPDPPRSTYSRSYTPGKTYSSTRTITKTSGGAGGGDDDGKGGGGHGIPGFEVSLAITMVAMAALVARRRL